MNLIHLKAFLAVMQTGSFSQAAVLLYTSQSVISKQIMALERDLDVPLFSRLHRHAVPTYQAQAILPLAQRLLDDYSALLAAADESVPHLEISSIPVMAQYGITTLVADFRRLHPEIFLNIVEREGRTIPDFLRAKTCELAFLRLVPHLQPQYDNLPFAQDRLVAVLPAGHLLAGRQILPLSALSSESFLLLDEGTLLYDVCLNACQAQGFIPQVSYTGTRAENILELVAHGMGVSLMMERTVAYFHTSGVYAIPLEVPVESTIALAALPGHSLSAGAKIFWEFTASLAKLSGPGSITIG